MTFNQQKICSHNYSLTTITNVLMVTLDLYVIKILCVFKYTIFPSFLLGRQGGCYYSVPLFAWKRLTLREIKVICQDYKINELPESAQLIRRIFKISNEIYRLDDKDSFLGTA